MKVHVINESDVLSYKINLMGQHTSVTNPRLLMVVLYTLYIMEQTRVSSYFCLNREIEWEVPRYCTVHTLTYTHLFIARVTKTFMAFSRVSALFIKTADAIQVESCLNIPFLSQFYFTSTAINKCFCFYRRRFIRKIRASICKHFLNIFLMLKI